MANADSQGSKKQKSDSRNVASIQEKKRHCIRDPDNRGYEYVQEVPNPTGAKPGRNQPNCADQQSNLNYEQREVGENVGCHTIGLS